MEQQPFPFLSVGRNYDCSISFTMLHGRVAFCCQYNCFFVLELVALHFLSIRSTPDVYLPVAHTCFFSIDIPR